VPRAPVRLQAIRILTLEPKRLQNRLATTRPRSLEMEGALPQTLKRLVLSVSARLWGGCIYRSREGKQRLLGVPAIRDRAEEMAAVLVLEPIFEADLPAEQYAYRRDRSALDAVTRVHELIYAGHQEIVDADLSSHYDRIPHAELLKSIACRILDGGMLHLIKIK
jgi:hypothetical protein